MSATVDAPLAPPAPPWRRWAGVGLLALVALSILWAAFSLYMGGQALLGAVLVAVAAVVGIVFARPALYAMRFVLPGLIAVAVFIAFPVVYTIGLGFTNYSSFNLLTFERATQVILSRTSTSEGTTRPFAVAEDGDAYRVFFPEGEGGFLSAPVALDGAAAVVGAEAVDAPPAALLERRDAIRLRDGLGAIEVTLPDGTGLRNAGLRDFAEVVPDYARQEDGTLLGADGAVLVPNHEIGFYVTEDGTRVPPGWRVWVGLENFERIFASDGIRGPMGAIFVWTIVFAFLSMAFTFALGIALASVLQWPHLRGREIYRVALILPYAVPAFISILVFRGLFNQNFGEVNLILETLFGIRPDWFTDAGLARGMIVLVNVWLGYPYMMLLAMGFLQGVPEDHLKAAALEGAGALRVFFTITLPQILPPFLPLLISTFAFNFNNLVLILLLTRGLPDIPGTVIPAGQTDILGSFTYRIAFMDSGQQFGLAGAITLLIFVVVAGLAYANFVLMRRAANRRAS